MAPYIRMNTEFRKKAKNNFKKDFYKLMNNSVFGKTMENLRNQVDMRLARLHKREKIRKLIANPLYSRHKFFANDLARIQMHKSLLYLNKPVYTGITILENSKILMYDFFYNVLKRQYGKRCELLYTGTDSMLLEIKTEDIQKDMADNIGLYDTSEYPEGHLPHLNKNKKVLGKMKDETTVTPIAECVCLQPKMYSILMADGKIIKKAKGVKKNVVKKQIRHGMHILHNEKHGIFGMHVNKTSLLAFDSKRRIADDGVNTFAYGHRPPLTEEDVDAILGLFTQKPVLAHEAALDHFFQQGFFKKFRLVCISGFDGEHAAEFAGEEGVVGTVAKVGSIANFVAAARAVDRVQLAVVGDAEAGDRVCHNWEAVRQGRFTAPPPTRIENVRNRHFRNSPYVQMRLSGCSSVFAGTTNNSSRT